MVEVVKENRLLLALCVSGASVHMNGRVYDPRLARFLSADPFIPDASSTQSYNRYSYVRNNPINRTDPSGYFDVKRLVGGIVGIILAVWNPFLLSNPAVAGLVYGAIAGGAGAAANGGDITRGIVLGGISGAAFGAVSSAIPASSTAFAGAIQVGKSAYMTAANFGKLVLAQAVVGGVMAEVSGGKFGHGFAAAGLTKFATPAILDIDNIVGESIASAVVGGTVSEVTGGKFANGATTAAFLYAFNALSSNDEGSVSKGGDCSGELKCSLADETYSGHGSRVKIDGANPEYQKIGKFKCNCSSTDETRTFFAPGEKSDENIFGVQEKMIWSGNAHNLRQVPQQYRTYFTIDSIDTWFFNNRDDYQYFIDGYNNNYQSHQAVRDAYGQ